jgi:gamma-glutamyl:cysteine ligase YbdK (ATP-grasp superfamily)
VGQEIAATHFRHHDFQQFEQCVKHELSLLREWFHNRCFSKVRSIGGLELETWLVSEDGQPLPINEQVLAIVNSPDIVPELSRFNIEFNVTPQPLAGNGIELLTMELDTNWQACELAARQLGASVMSIGILPTIMERHLTLANISSFHRYRALNEQVMRMRQGRPIRLHIEGREQLQVEHHDVMLESGATSLQLHLQVPMDDAVRFYNAAIILSAPLVAVAANSPLLFGKILWEESRIPLFEQAVDVGEPGFARVTFGSGYAQCSLEECFIENHARYKTMLPFALDEPSERLIHLRLQNGTIWRWNRPLIGFDADGTPHWRVEHRVMGAGPTSLDMAANAALFYGLAQWYATSAVSPESRLPFEAARKNFYAAARFGLEAKVDWLDGREWLLDQLVLRELLPQARRGLDLLEVDRDLSERLLGVIESRVASGNTGAAWQRRFVSRHGRDLTQLTIAYRERQRSRLPVHTWEV